MQSRIKIHSEQEPLHSPSPPSILQVWTIRFKRHQYVPHDRVCTITCKTTICWEIRRICSYRYSHIASLCLLLVRTQILGTSCPSLFCCTPTPGCQSSRVSFTNDNHTDSAMCGSLNLQSTLTEETVSKSVTPYPKWPGSSNNTKATS